MLSGRVATEQVVSFDIYELVTKRNKVPENDRRNISSEKVLIGARFSSQAIGRHDEQTIHATRNETPNAGLFSFGFIERLGHEDIVTEIESPLLDGQYHPRINRAGERGYDDSQQP